MLEIAILNPHGLQQFHCRDQALLLAQLGDRSWSLDNAAQRVPGSEVVRLSAIDGAERLVVESLARTSGSGQKTPSERKRKLTLPARFTVGDSWFDVGRQRRDARTLLPLQTAEQAVDTPSPSAATLSQWFEALGTLHCQSATSKEFYTEAARFVVDPIGLDGAVVLLREADQWFVAAAHLPYPELGVRYDDQVLAHLAKSPQTWWEGPPAGDERCSIRVLRDAVELQTRLAELQQRSEKTLAADVADRGDGRAVVVAPLVDGEGSLGGAIYGFRAVHEGNSRRSIRALEARLVDLLASSVSSGIIRLQGELATARQRAIVAQAFSPAVAQKLQHDPAILDGQDREVTVLFADLRNFTSICTELGTRDSYLLLNEVMECLTSAVNEQEGVVIDYYGDGLSAMWNAPVQQPEHAELACRAAFEMLATLPPVSLRWQARLARPLRIGVGVHTGLATVGNVGSRQRIKYGPRGATVNLASRVESATKRLRIPLVITGATAERLSSHLRTYRVCRARLAGIQEEVDLYAVFQPGTSRDRSAVDRYQHALALYEAGQLDEAEDLLAGSDCPVETIPLRFLADEIRYRRHRRLGRRETDTIDAPESAAIALDAR